MVYFLIIIISLLVLLKIAILFYLTVGQAPLVKEIQWGVNFSQMHTEVLGLNWREVYLSLIKELGARHIKLHTQWDWVEGKRNEYYFEDIDWQIKEAEKNGVKIIYVVGMKTGRWPECHLPLWAQGLSKEEQQREILEYIKEVVLRYKDSPALLYWQVENEPFFKFGECPWQDLEFVKKEVELVKSLDPTHPVIISDSGEQSMWFKAAKIGDIVGTTMYRRVWVSLNEKIGFPFKFFLSPVFYWRKALLIEKFFDKKVICIELQAEPWGSKLLYDLPLSEQEKTMDLKKFQETIQYARRSGLDTFYLWGAEWWYWLKEKHQKPEIWNEAKKLFKREI